MIGDHDAGCSCCNGRSDQTPLPLANRPGLGSIAYRAGTYGSFLASMLAGLSRSSRPDLAALRTREPDDLSIALIDAWAVAADVLTFSTERIANEHYLGTATERRSVAEMAALLGYRLGPGVAAQAWLAFMLETSPGAPAESLIAAGSRTQTLPGPGEVPQTFETLEPLLAVAAWNQPALLLSEARTPQTDDACVLLNDIALNLKPGDQLLFVAANRSVAAGAGRWAAVRVTNVSSNPGRDETTVTFSP